MSQGLKEVGFNNDYDLNNNLRLNIYFFVPFSFFVFVFWWWWADAAMLSCCMLPYQCVQVIHDYM
jgi:hypothetical protein